jgi:peptide/nickel transport system permease protein
MPRALRLIRRRLLNAVPVIFLVVLGTYALLAAAPGDAVDSYLAQVGGDAGLVAELRQRWGLEGSFAVRILAYASSLARFDLGPSVAFSRPVVEVIFSRLPNTLLLMSAAIAMAFSLGSALGVAAGARPGSVRDRLLSVVSLIIYATPGFWLGLMLIILLSVKLSLLPLGGIETIASGKTGPARALDIAAHLVMPTLALGLVYLALYLRLMRAGMVEAWRSDHVLLARAKGLARRRLVLRHVARNALLPVVTMLGLQAGSMLGGSVVIESVFAIPGLGRLAFEAVTQRDLPLLLGIVLVGTLVVIAVNLLVDIAYAWLDPRVGAER